MNISGKRGTVTIDASFGLGEALVSGVVSPDFFQVRGEQIITAKKVAIFAKPEGGTILFTETLVGHPSSLPLPV
jgi:pyruvate,water dikinase